MEKYCPTFANFPKITISAHCAQNGIVVTPLIYVFWVDLGVSNVGYQPKYFAEVQNLGEVEIFPVQFNNMQ